MAGVVVSLYFVSRRSPGELSVRYDMDERDLPDHPKHHLQCNRIGETIRKPTGEVTCVQVLQMIYASLLW